MIDDRRLDIQGGQLDLEVFRLARSASEEQADADLPGLAVLARPVSDGNDTVGRVLAEGELRHDVLQAPGPDLDAVLVADLQECAQAGLQLPCRPRQRPLGRQVGQRRLHLLVPRLGQGGEG